MDNKNLAEKVGLFVFVCLALLGALLIMFSKGVTQFSHTYEIHLKTTDAGGIKPGANVLMAGYPIGNVAHLTLTPDGGSVTLILTIKKEYQIHNNALFVLEQAGFLGDQFVAVYPSTDKTAPMLENGAEVSCPPPFNLQETAREAGSFIKRLDETADRLNAAIADVRRLVLNEETLTNLSATVGNMRVASERAISTIDSLDAVVAENGPKLGISASNIVSFSSEMSQLAGTLGEVIQTNSTQLTVAMQNIASASESLKSLADDLKTGKGLVGTLIKNETLANNVQTLAANLSITSSNLNRVGIWGILWAQKPPRTNAPAPRSAGKNRL